MSIGLSALCPSNREVTCGRYTRSQTILPESCFASLVQAAGTSDLVRRYRHCCLTTSARAVEVHILFSPTAHALHTRTWHACSTTSTCVIQC
eukprot:54685-Eustigmatos_ZCMA.PRE.1